MEIVFLGTSAAIPTARRNTSSIALIRDGEILLFDCGEGTQMQYQKAGLRPGKLTKIFISHFHGDHLYGLIGFLTTLQLSGRTERLELYGPAGLGDYVGYMKKMGSFEFNYTLEINEVDVNSSGVIWEFDEYTIVSKPLEHRIFALGFRLQEKSQAGKFDVQKAEILGIPPGPQRAELQKGRPVITADGNKINPEEVVGPSRPGKVVVICLDTKRCANAVALAEDANLLIHEATFDRSRDDLAEATCHATARDAAVTASEANARKLILTHISARFGVEDELLLLDEAKTVFREVVIAQDLLRLTV